MVSSYSHAFGYVVHPKLFLTGTVKTPREASIRGEEHKVKT